MAYLATLSKRCDNPTCPLAATHALFDRSAAMVGRFCGGHGLDALLRLQESEDGDERKWAAKTPTPRGV